MANTISSRVISLLAQWEERKESGEELSPEDLCKNSPELVDQVKAQLDMLRGFTIESLGDFETENSPKDKLPKASFKDLTGTIIAERYRVTKHISDGGMGSVWQAEQLHPVKRQVALKLILNKTKTTAQVIRRFEAERQALAMMDHPGIARIYDGGVTEWKDPYFVMELVPGVPLTKYCDDKRLSVKQRLELFVSICQAVQHAHQKGIIHRDLKPGNILVAEVDDKPVPKVIDFGVAKAVDQKLTEETIHDFGTVVGTLSYMSPEQADYSVVDIDTRTDVYALGVILFELLVGCTPVDTKQLKNLAIRELQRLFSDQEPPRLSTKLSSAENLPTLAAARSTEPGLLTKAVQGDLEWIVLKALEKDRARRYETAYGFADDVQRHLAGEAVLAHPPSRWYLLRKFALRNRAKS